MSSLFLKYSYRKGCLKLQNNINAEINPEDSHLELLMGLKKKELQEIRRNWNFKGISGLNKKPLAVELSRKISSNILPWLETQSYIYPLIKAIATNDDGVIYPEINSKRDLQIIKYLQEMGVVFPGKYEDDDIILFMPPELRTNIKSVIKYNTSLDKKIAGNQEIVLLTIGFLVYYGVYSIIKIHQRIVDDFSYKIKVNDYYSVIYQFLKSNGIIYQDNNKLVLTYVLKPDRVAKEIQKRPQLDYYKASKEELMSAGEHISPPFNTQYMALFSYLEKEQINSEKAEDILIRVYLDINNDTSFDEVFKIVVGMTGFDSSNQVEELSRYLKPLNNNTHHWILKGNIPTEVINRDRKTVIDGDDNVSEISRDNNVVNLSEFRKIKRDDRQK